MIGGVACGLPLCIIGVSSNTVDLFLAADVGWERVGIGREVRRSAIGAGTFIGQCALNTTILSAVSCTKNENL